MQERWLGVIASQPMDGLLIGGDIAESGQAIVWLERLVHQVHVPIYFVLGNHDFYDGTIRHTRQEIVRLCRKHEQLHYLTDCSPIELRQSSNLAEDSFYLVGEDAWGDATKGDFDNSFVKLSDFSRIRDFATLTSSQQKSELQSLGSHSAKRLSEKLKSLPAETRNILVLTHVPPFVESCWYKGQTADKHWSPFFVCGQTGEVLERFASEYPDRQIVVLCGHSHHAGSTRLSTNLVVHTGNAEVGDPSFVGTLEIKHATIELDRLDPI